jgi:hypothetical protein
MSFTLSKIVACKKFTIYTISIHGIPIKFYTKYCTTLERNRSLIAPLISVANFGNEPAFHPRRKDTLDRAAGIRKSNNGKKR